MVNKDKHPCPTIARENIAIVIAELKSKHHLTLGVYFSSLFSNFVYFF